jgi:hypothetical protein
LKVFGAGGWHLEKHGGKPRRTWRKLYLAGAHNYWKSQDLERLDDALLDVIVEHAGRLPTAECEIFLPHFGGALRRVAGDATAFPHRTMKFLLNIHPRWYDPADDESCMAWARSFATAAAAHATGGVYVNFMPADEAGRISGAYGGNHARPGALKARYDPGNLFHINQNIQPAI